MKDSTEKKTLFTSLLKMAAGNQQSIPRRKLDTPIPLSFSQQRMWLFNQLEPESPAYNIVIAYRLTGSLNVKVFEKCLNDIVQRHEILRTTFVIVHGKPLQFIRSTIPLPFVVRDFRTLPEDEGKEHIQHVLSTESRHIFDLSEGPLFRITLMRSGEEEYTLLLVIHHIISDGWTISVFFRELKTRYEAFLTGKPSPLPELPVQYADFAVWQREWLQGDRLETLLSYWREQLNNSPLLFDLPASHPRPPVQTFRGATHSFCLSKAFTRSLKQFSQQEDVTLFMLLLAAFSILLYRYSSQEDILIGSPVANRHQAEIEGLIGAFVNTIVLRTELSGNPTFRDILNRVKTMTLDAYAHQVFPFEQLVEALRPEQNLSHSGLVQVMFVLQNYPPVPREFAGIHMTPIEVDNKTAKFDLSLIMEERREGLFGIWEYNTDLFDEEMITHMLGHFQVLLNEIIANPEQRINDVSLLTKSEGHQLLVAWNDTRTVYPHNKCIHHLFEEQVEREPDVVSLVCGELHITYRELNRRANQLAHYLKKSGVTPEMSVGFCLERSVEMITVLLGILKAGGTYIPFDPNYPEERLAFMIEDTHISILITQQKFLGIFPDIQMQSIVIDAEFAAISEERDKNLIHEEAAENLAYVLYTSGSTGTPKGVCIPHQGVVRLTQGTNYVHLTSKDIFLQLAPLSFDASTFEIWGALLNGARLVIMPIQHPSLQEIGAIIQQQQISALWLTAGLFRLMVEDRFEDLKPVRQLLAGGDVLSVSHVRKVARQLDTCTLINGYGPTENTTFSCCFPVNQAFLTSDSVPIGRPIANTQVYILDPSFQPVPIRVPGELYISGDGLARSYLNRPDLTAEAFLPHPFSEKPGARLYKTGDLARYLPDGNIEFLGRCDRQVKLRGFRVELREIESVLSRHPEVGRAVVLLREDTPGNKHLAAYITSDRNAASSEELREYLQQKLPEYMIPSTFVFLEAFPLTSNGKIDLNALPPPDQRQLGREKVTTAPRTPIEEILVETWEEIFEVKPIGIHDNFFDLGGHSLLAIRLIARIDRDFNLELSVRDILEMPTIAELGMEILQKRMQQEDANDIEEFFKHVE